MTLEEDRDFEGLIRSAERREVKAPNEIDEKYDINPALSDDIGYSQTLHFMQLLAEREGDERMQERISLLKDYDKMRSIATIARKLDGEDLLELISQKKELDLSSSESLIKTMMEEE